MSQQAAAASKVHLRFARWPVMLAAVGAFLGLPRPTAAQFGPAPSYGAPSTLILGTNPLTVAAADLNHDGKLDLVIPANAAGTVLVLFGNGSGGFAPGPVIGVGTFPEAAAVADLNADTHPDIVVTNLGPSDVSVLLGDGVGGFTAAPGSPFATGTSPFGIVIADVNADTFPDLVVASAGSDSVSVLLGTGTGAFGAATNFAVGVGPRDVAVADLNNDGLGDIVATNYGAGGGTTASVLIGTGGGGFAAAVDYTTGPAPRTVALADLNGDTKPDAVVANLDGGTFSAIAVLLGNGDGTFQAAANYGGAAGGAAHGVAVGDFNVDGKVDVAVTNSNLTTITLFNGDGAGNLLSPGTFFTVGANPFFIGVGDFNGDGRDDLAVTNFGSGSASVFLNTLALSADLAISKTGPASVLAGQTITYTTTVTNLGPNNALAVSVADPTPSGLTFVSNTGACTTPFPCPLGTLIAGQLRTITSTFLVPSGYSGGSPFANTATVSSSTSDPTPGNDSSAASTAVTFSADLSMVKTDSADPVNASSNFSYTLAVSNAGPSTAQSLTVTDPLPAGVTSVSATGTDWACGEAGGTVTCTRTSLAVGAAPAITITVTAPAAGGTINNTASVSATTADPAAANNSEGESTTVTAEADVSIVKTDSADPVNASTNFSYTLTVANAGPSTAQSLTVTDALPAGVTYVSATGTDWACGEVGATVTCTRSSLAVGAAPAITITVTAPTAGGTINNTASVSATTADPAAGNNSEGESTAVTAQADLSIVKTDSADPVNAGGNFSYTLAVSNAGPSTAQSLTVTDPLPAGVTYVSATGTDWACGEAGGTVTCTRTSLAVGAAPAITITVTAPAAGGTINNTASVSATTADPAAGNNSEGESTAVTAQADLSIAKTDSADPVNASTNFSYTLTVSNAGPSTAQSPTVTDPLPAGVTYVSATGTDWACGEVGATVTCTRSSLAVGAAPAITITVTAPTAGGTINNTASVLATTADPAAGNNSEGESTAVTAQADLSIAKTDSADPVNASTNFSYTLTVANAGPSTAQSLTVTDALPAGVTYVSATGTDWACGEVGATVTCTRSSLAVGAAPAITITVTAPTAGGTINNTASVLATTADPAAGNNSEGESTAVTAQADVSVTLIDAPDPVAGLGTLTYTITVANAGPSAASGVSVVHTLPAGVTFSSVTGSGWSCSAPGTVNCSLVSLASGATAPLLSVAVTVGPASATLNSSVTVSATQGDPNATNNSASAQTTVNGVPHADLSMVVTASAATALWGRPVTYTITATNGGPDAVTGATVSDAFPAGLTAVTWTCTASHGSSCTPASSGNIDDTAVNLPSGGTVTYSATGVVVYGTAGPLVNTATVSSSIHDPIAANNASTVNKPVDVDLVFKNGFEGSP